MWISSLLFTWHCKTPERLKWQWCALSREPLHTRTIKVRTLGCPETGKSCFKGRLRTVDLLALTSSDQLLLILKILFTLFTKTSYLNEEVNGTEPTLRIVFPVLNIKNHLSMIWSFTINFFSRSTKSQFQQTFVKVAALVRQSVGTIKCFEYIYSLLFVS